MVRATPNYPSGQNTRTPSCPKIQTYPRPGRRDVSDERCLGWTERMVWRRALLGSAYRRVSAASAGLRQFREHLQDSSFRLRSYFWTRRLWRQRSPLNWDVSRDFLPRVDSCGARSCVQTEALDEPKSWASIFPASIRRLTARCSKS